MKFYKVVYTLGRNGEYLYPPSTANVVWKSAHYHNTEHAMVGETDNELEADGEYVVKLSKKDAKSIMDEFGKSFPELPEEHRRIFPVPG